MDHITFIDNYPKIPQWCPLLDDNEDRDKLLIKIACLEERIDNLILEATDRWHKSKSEIELKDWLGISEKEYDEYFVKINGS
jgi:predicted type IV restriction endonuclease